MSGLASRTRALSVLLAAVFLAGAGGARADVLDVVASNENSLHTAIEAPIQADFHREEASYRYRFEVPPGTAGLTLSPELQYSSEIGFIP